MGENALLDDPATESYEIEVAADSGGAVTLTGTVQSWQERQLAETVVAGVTGVTAINNRIDVAPADSRPDEEIAADVRAKFRWDGKVDHGLIDVVVEDGTVHLSGEVGSLAEKNVAVANAWVSGVKAVEADDLAVGRWARNEAMRGDKYHAQSDRETEKAVQDALMYDARVSAFTIDVDADSGIVTLRGSVSNLKAKRAALANARSTVGVIAVRDRIRVRPGETFPQDPTIVAEVHEALARDPIVGSADIDVRSVGGIVDLNGTVGTWFEKGQADDVAARVKGVLSVDNNLVVDDDAFAQGFDPYVDAWSIHGFEWYEPRPRSPHLPDSVVARQIEHELPLSPYVEAADLSISVENGVATLTGEVESWSERRAATENALEGGAVTVVNDLTVLAPDEQNREARLEEQE